MPTSQSEETQAGCVPSNGLMPSNPRDSRSHEDETHEKLHIPWIPSRQQTLVPRHAQWPVDEAPKIVHNIQVNRSNFPRSIPIETMRF
jgi:hypothetical protein